MIPIIVIAAAVVVLIVVLVLILRHGRSARVNPVHHDRTSRYPAAETQMQPGYDPDGLVDSPDEYGPLHRPRTWFGRRRVNSR